MTDQAGLNILDGSRVEPPGAGPEHLLLRAATHIWGAPGFTFIERYRAYHTLHNLALEVFRDRGSV